MNGLLYLIGAIGFQIDDMLTTFFVKFLDNGRVRDFVVLGVVAGPHLFVVPGGRDIPTVRLLS